MDERSLLALELRMNAVGPLFRDPADRLLWKLGHDAEPVFDSVEAAEAALHELRQAFPNAPEMTLSIEED